MSIINEEIDTEFQGLFAQIFSETTLDEHIDFDVETVISEPVVDPTHVYRRQECREKSIAEVLQSEDTVLINDSDDGITDDEQDVKKVTASEALDSHEQINVMLNELIGKVETLKLQNIRQNTIHIFFKK